MKLIQVDENRYILASALEDLLIQDTGEIHLATHDHSHEISLLLSDEEDARVTQSPDVQTKVVDAWGAREMKRLLDFLVTGEDSLFVFDTSLGELGSLAPALPSESQGS